MPQRRYAVPFLMCRSNHRFTDGYDYKLLCLINLIAIKKCKSILLNNKKKPCRNTLQGFIFHKSDLYKNTTHYHFRGKWFYNL